MGDKAALIFKLKASWLPPCPDQSHFEHTLLLWQAREIVLLVENVHVKKALEHQEYVRGGSPC